jgi:hypothetical protein
LETLEARQEEVIPGMVKTKCKLCPELRNCLGLTKDWVQDKTLRMPFHAGKIKELAQEDKDGNAD